MKRITIEFGNGSRLVVYKEGGCQLERYVPGIGWCLDNGNCDAIPLLAEAQSLLARVEENITLAA